MVYDSDFYTTRRPYSTRPTVSSYTISGPSRQVRVLPGLGKVHVSYSYDRLVPYVGHKRLTVVTAPPRVWSTRPSVLQREFDRIENKVRPWTGYSATNRYLNSDSAVRTYYVSYPITGSDYYNYSTLSLPSSTYLPKVYRWYYSWPRTYQTYWPYMRTYLTNYLKNYYLNNDWPSYYWSTYLPWYRNLDYDFYELENKIDNLRRTLYLDYPDTTLRALEYPYSSSIKALDYTYYPYSYRYYRPLSLYYDYYWPLSSLNRYSSYWPSYYYSYRYPYYRYLYYKYTLPSDRYYYLKGIFDDETRLIRAQTASLLKRIHDPVPRVQRFSWPSSVTTKHYDDVPARLYNDNYIHRLFVTSPKSKSEYVTYYTEPVRKYIGDRAYSRRPHIYLYEDPLKNDIQLLSYYINKFKQEKAISGGGENVKVPLNPARPTRKFGPKAADHDGEAAKEMQKLREARAARLAFINEEEKIERSSVAVDDAVKAKKKKEEERLAEEKALAEEQSRREAQAKKAEEAAKKAEAERQEALARHAAAEKAAELERQAEIARQEDLAAKAAAEKAAELERQAELAKQEELAKQAELEKARKAEEERIRLEEQRRLEEEAKAEEVRQQQERLEELARQAKEEEEAELARQAEELAELARQEAELAEQAKKEAEAAELARQEEELAELERQQAELEELERKEQELAELAEKARLEAEEAAKREADEIARRELEAAAEEDAPSEEDLIQKTSEEEARKAEEELARQQAELEELERQEAELAELERQQAELDALESEAKALEAENEAEAEKESSPPEEEEEDEDARKQHEMDELIQQKFEMAELERQQAELDALDAEARALAEGTTNADDDEDEPAIAEDTPVHSDVEE